MRVQLGWLLVFLMGYSISSFADDRNCFGAGPDGRSLACVVVYADCHFGLSLYIESNLSIPLTVAVNAQINQSSDATYFRIVNDPEFFDKVFDFDMGCNHSYDYAFDYTVHVGDSMATHDDTYVYMLPFKRGSSVKVVQGYNGSFSHSGPLSFALDFEVPVGTEVYAARSGTVVGIRSDSRLGGTSPVFHGLENYIWIMHEDKTVAWYEHLNTNGVVVKLGQEVKAGELIGYSGNTGYSNGPHLHFHVSTAIGRDDPPNISHPNHLDAFKTFPTKFRTTKGVEELAEGQTYAAP